MKIFTQESVIEEVVSSMESNLVKNATSIQQVDASHRYQALECLAEAAVLFEKAGKIEKASDLTYLIDSLSNKGKSRDQAIKNKIALLESTVNNLQSVYEVDSNEVNKYLLNSTANKITGLLANVTSTTSDIIQSVASLKSGYDATPKTLDTVSAALEIAQGTLAVVAEHAEDIQSAKDKKKKKKKKKNTEDKKKNTDMVEVLKYFGFGMDGSSCDSGDSADCGDNMKSDDYNPSDEWEK